MGRRRAVTAGVLLFLFAMVMAFTGGFRRGDVLIDGPGVSMMMRILLGHWRDGNGIPAWLPDVWSGTPIWELVGSFHLAVLMPLAGLFGPEEAVKLGILGAQVAGAWGAFVLARSLWGRTWPAAAAGLLYGLHPYFASSGPLSGHETSLWVFAATPWLGWSLRKALRREGLQYVGVSGLLVAFALLQQAEHAYSLVLFCGILLAVELSRAKGAEVGPLRPAGVLARASAVVLIGLGLVAHWIFPFLVRSKSFVLTPPEDVRVALDLIAGALGRRPQAFVSRATPMTGTYDFEELGSQVLRMEGAAASGFYLGLVCLAVTLVTVLWLARHDDDDGTLSAILFVSALGIWMSTGTVTLASGGLATPSGAPVLAVLGLAVGLLGGNLLRRLRLGRAAQAAAAGAAVLLFALPFVTPITAVQGLIPFLGEIRFPRIYPLAALGVALGAVFPLTLVERRAARRPDRSPYLGPAAAVLLMAAFLVDVAPYRSLYRLRLPSSAAAYQEVAGTFGDLGTGYRMIPADDGDPEAVAALLRSGARVSGGWPHPLASPAVWKLTKEAIQGSPVGYRNAALGLSSTAYIATQVPTDIGDVSREISRVQLEPVPNALPVVRAYERVVVVKDGDVAPELAVALAGRGVGVVTGGAGAAGAVAVTAPTTIGASDACGAAALPRTDLGLLGGELAMACSLHPWVGVRRDRALVGMEEQTGAVFDSPVDGLRGVAVWLVGALGPTELALRQVGADGVSLGPEILRVRPDGVDETGMTRFGFDPLADSAGKTYSFALSCAGCTGADAPQMLAITRPRGKGGLTVGARLRPLQAAAFSPLYERMPAAVPSATELAATRVGPGRWSIEADGPRAALVVVAESHFPGWEARVDGKRVPVVTADGGFLGVAVGPGPHHVALEYHRPSAATVGRVVTGATLLICLVLVCPPLRRRMAAVTERRRPRR